MPRGEKWAPATRRRADGLRLLARAVHAARRGAALPRAAVSDRARPGVHRRSGGLVAGPLEADGRPRMDGAGVPGIGGGARAVVPRSGAAARRAGTRRRAGAVPFERGAGGTGDLAARVGGSAGAAACRVSRPENGSRRWPWPRLPVPTGRRGSRPVPIADGRLTGEKRYVLDAPAADLFVVAARGPSGVGWYVVEDGASVTTQRSYDITRPIGSLTLDGTPSERLAEPGLDPGLRIATAALTAEMVGTASKILDLSVSYAKEREQFGRPIGSFQAIKHKCAEMLTDLESSRSAAFYACWAVATDAEDADLAVAVAKSYGSDALARLGGRRRSGARRHRVHLGARHASVPEADQDRGSLVRRCGRTSRAHRAARRTVESRSSRIFSQRSYPVLDRPLLSYARALMSA